MDIYIGVSAGAAIILLFALWQTTRCLHAWELVDKTELPSRLEEMVKNGCSPSRLYNDQLIGISRRTLILALRCPKCGVARIHKETSA